MADRYISRHLPHSKSANSCSLTAHLAWPHLAYVADVWGRFDADPKSLHAALFPKRTDATPAMVASWLQEWAKAEMIVLYSAKGYQCGAILHWDEYQRETVRWRAKAKNPIPSRIPEPPRSGIMPSNSGTEEASEPVTSRSGISRPMLGMSGPSDPSDDQHVRSAEIPERRTGRAQRSELAKGTAVVPASESDPMLHRFQSVFPMHNWDEWAKFCEFREQIGESAATAALDEARNNRARRARYVLSVCASIAKEGLETWRARNAALRDRPLSTLSAATAGQAYVGVPVDESKLINLAEFDAMEVQRG